MIGKNNNKYKLDNFDSVNSETVSDITNYYKQIKCVVNLSYFESCSNVMVESIFNGCVYVNRKKIQNDLIFNFPNNYNLLSKTNRLLISQHFQYFQHSDKKNILFVDEYKGVKSLKTLLQIANFINNSFGNIIIILFVGIEYYKLNPISLKDFSDL